MNKKPRFEIELSTISVRHQIRYLVNLHINGEYKKNFQTKQSKTKKSKTIGNMSKNSQIQNSAYEI